MTGPMEDSRTIILGRGLRKLHIMNFQNELCKYTLSDDFGKEDAVEVGKFSKNSGGDWEFKALGEGHVGGIQALIKKFASNF